VPLHEWQTTEKEPLIDIITWVFEEGTFVLAARIKGDNSQSIITDYLGTPTAMYDAKGEKTWETNLDIYGKVRTFVGRSLSDCPFRYQGQYQDEETGLYYNRFKYYDPSLGYYISKDPIRLAGGNRFYCYVNDVNRWIDELGLAKGDPIDEWIDPNKLNFSQAYITDEVNQMIDDMNTKNWDGNRSGSLDVAEIDGQMVSLDNRRLYAAQEAGLDSVPIRKVDLNAPRSGGGTYRSNLNKKLNSRPKSRPDLPKVQLPQAGTSTKPTVVAKHVH
jgi:RHS repeat-associated protein